MKKNRCAKGLKKTCQKSSRQKEAELGIETCMVCSRNHALSGYLFQPSFELEPIHIEKKMLHIVNSDTYLICFFFSVSGI